MTLCTNCRTHVRPDSRISQGILDQCYKNCRGSCSACAELQDLDRKINGARRALEQLLDAREDMASTLNEHHDPFSQRLPIEVVSRIFVHSLPFKFSQGEQLLALDFNEKQHINAVFNLGRVCRWWRKVSRLTPELWTVFSTTITQTNCVTSIFIAQEWLERSGALGIYVGLRANAVTDAIFSHSIERVITAITPHSQRWTTLDIELPSACLTLLSSELSNEKLNWLGHIALQVIDDEGSSTLKLAASPSFYLTRTSLGRISVNWDRLRDIVALVDVALSLEECLQLFREAPHLEFCRIKDVDGEVQEKSLNHLSLQDLTVDAWSASFWNALSCPSLRSLGVGWPRRGDTQGFSSVKHFLVRSGCHLTEMRFFGDKKGRRADGMVELLKLTPDLEKLTVSGNRLLNGNLFSAMNVAAVAGGQQQSTSFLSRLVSLICMGSRCSWSDFAIFIITMTSRRERSLKLIKFIYFGQNSEVLEGIDMDKDTFKLVMDAVQASGLKFEMIDNESGSDLLERLRCRYNL